MRAKDCGSIAKESADDWFTISPKYRTKERLMAHIQRAINEAVMFLEGLEEEECE